MSNGCCWAIADPIITTDASPPDTGNFTVSVVSTKESQFPRQIALDSWIAGALEDIDARSRITYYLSLIGTEQRAERESLVKWFNTSRWPQRHIESLLKLIDKGMSEPRLEAAIDLLARLGPAVVNLAIQSAASPRREDSTAAYALAIAAGRIESSLIWIFVRSPNDAFREAVINLADDLPRDEGLPFLWQLASDSHPSIRRLASLALSD
jgi:hypothetical protein